MRVCVPFSTPFLSFLWCVVDFWWNYSLMPLSTCAFTLNCLRLLVLHSPLSLRWMPKNQEKHGKKQRDICIIFSLASELVENESQTKHTHTIPWHWSSNLFIMFVALLAMLLVLLLLFIFWCLPCVFAFFSSSWFCLVPSLITSFDISDHFNSV